MELGCSQVPSEAAFSHWVGKSSTRASEGVSAPFPASVQRSEVATAPLLGPHGWPLRLSPGLVARFKGSCASQA